MLPMIYDEVVRKVFDGGESSEEGHTAESLIQRHGRVSNVIELATRTCQRIDDVLRFAGLRKREASDGWK